MPSRKQAQARPAPQAPVEIQPTDVPFWFTTAALYAIVLVLLRPTLAYEPLALDDANLLRELSTSPVWRVFGYDRFGHWRPAKSLLFWLVAHHPEALGLVRAAVVGAFAVSVAAVQRLATGLLASRWWGLAAAACFGLNPSVLGSVAWLSASNYVLCLLFTLAFVHAAARALKGASTIGRLWALRAMAFAALFLAVLHHEIALLAPLLLAVLPRRGRADWRSVAWLAAAWLTAVGLELASRGFAERPEVVYRMAAQPKWALVLSAARYTFTDLHLWLWPRTSFGVLWVDDPTAQLGWSAAAWAALLLLAVGAFRLGRADGPSGFALSWVALFLLPVTNLLPIGITPCAVHYLFLPGPGLSLLVARGAQLTAERAKAQGRRGAASWLPAAMVCSLCLLWLYDAPGTVATWSDATALYRAALANHPGNVEVRANLAAQHLEHGRLREAAKLLEESLELAPDDPILVANRFEQLMRTGPPSEALSFLDAHPDLSSDRYRFARAELLEALGKSGEAIVAFRTLAAESADPEVRFRSGVRHAKLYIDLGKYAEARRVVDRLLVQFPGHPNLLVMREMMLKEEAAGGHAGAVGGTH